jgi:hypothetical protein
MRSTIDLFHTILSHGGWATGDTIAIVASLGYVAFFGFPGIRYFRRHTRPRTPEPTCSPTSRVLDRGSCSRAVLTSRSSNLGDLRAHDRGLSRTRPVDVSHPIPDLRT